jgi:hypothetical protein
MAGIVPSSSILVTLLMERYVPRKRRFIQEPQGLTLQTVAFLKNVAICDDLTS